MQASDDRRNSVRAPMWAALVAGLHVVAVVCLFHSRVWTPKQAVVVLSPPPVMPPRQDAMAPCRACPVRPSNLRRKKRRLPWRLQRRPATPCRTVIWLSKIAAKVGVTSREIAELNNIKDANKIRVGQKLVLPSYAQSVPASANKPAAAPVKKPAPKASAPAVAGGGEYVVRSGDSLSKIAVKNGTTVKALREVNNLKSDMIRINQKLKLPAGAAKKADAAPAAPAPVPAPEVAAPAPVVEAPVVAPVLEAVAAAVASPAPAAGYRSGDCSGRHHGGCAVAGGNALPIHHEAQRYLGRSGQDVRVDQPADSGCQRPYRRGCERGKEDHHPDAWSLSLSC